MNWLNLSVRCALLYRLPTYRLPTHRLPIHRLPLTDLPTCESKETDLYSAFMMKERFASTLFIALAVHVFLALVFILNPGALIRTRISRIYRIYLLPGPFFDADRIVNSYSLYVSWKSKGQWSIPISPAKESFKRYNRWFNPADIYRSRFERTLYSGLVLKQGQ